MRKSLNILLLILLFLGLWFGWQWLMLKIWPPKERPESALVVFGKEAAEEGVANVQIRDADLYVNEFGMETAADGAAIALPLPDKEVVVMLAGSAITPIDPFQRLRPLPRPLSEIGELIATSGARNGIPKPPTPDPVIKAEPVDTMELIPLGYGTTPYYLQVLLNARGGSVQQIILTAFNEADREGLEVKVNRKPIPLHLVPGLKKERASTLGGQRDINESLPELQTGKIDPTTYNKAKHYSFAQQSYVLFHYETPDQDRPVDLLGNRDWTVVYPERDKATGQLLFDPDADEQRVEFQTDLAEPYNLRIKKTFTLKRKEYHIGMQVEISRIPGRTGVNQFRYQIQGAHGLPVEGEWYTSTFHPIIVGFGDDKGKTARYIDDAAKIRDWDGSDKKSAAGKLQIRYAATTVQYFASVIAVDDQQPQRGFIDYVRATPWGSPPPGKSGQEFLNDATVRTVTHPLDPDANVSHKYLLYQGPIKVRLLRQKPGGMEVDDALVERYLDKINLDTMTDAHMPNWFGRRADDIGWTDLVIAFTNIIHSLLYYLNQVIPSLGICIILLTIMVRGMLFPLSRRQSYNAQVMQAKMAKVQPEVRKLQEKYKDDFQQLQQERLKLYREHGINPFAALGGCFMLLLQMPVFMGLYYALQESVFFRLDGFLWIQNLAAPDMTFRWGESIPYISTPEDLGGNFLGGILYLGPFFNVLPIVAVTLMLYQQKKMMPVSDDPQVQAQQRMMKFMMILMGLFFYKMPAGLCIYFIASTLWGLTERRFMPKPPTPEEAEAAAAEKRREEELAEERPLGWWGRTKARWKEKWKRLLEEAQKQAEHRREQNQKQQQPPQPGAAPQPNRGGGKKKKRKR